MTIVNFAFDAPELTVTAGTTVTLTPADREALRQKYREERDKRLRADGNQQYVEMTGAFAHYLDDPYVDPTHLTVAPTAAGASTWWASPSRARPACSSVTTAEWGGPPPPRTPT